jgi:hypothetical protein
VMQRPRDVQTRGCLTAEDLHGLRILAVSRTMPAPRRRTGVPGASRCVVETPTGGSDLRDGVRSGDYNITQKHVWEAMSQVTL